VTQDPGAVHQHLYIIIIYCSPVYERNTQLTAEVGHSLKRRSQHKNTTPTSTVEHHTQTVEAGWNGTCLLLLALRVWQEKSTCPTRLRPLNGSSCSHPNPRKAAVGPASNRGGGALLNTLPALNSHRLLLRPAYRSSLLPLRSVPLVVPHPTSDAQRQKRSAASQQRKPRARERGLRSYSYPARLAAARPVSVHSHHSSASEREGGEGEGAGVKGGTELMAPAQEEQAEA
jgi:hypothetical protein